MSAFHLIWGPRPLHSASCLVFLGKLKKEALLGFLHRGLSPQHSLLSRPGRQPCQRECPQGSLMRLGASSAHSLAFPCQATHLQASRGSQLSGVLPRVTLEVLRCCKAPWLREHGACAGLAPCTAALHPALHTPGSDPSTCSAGSERLPLGPDSCSSPQRVLGVSTGAGRLHHQARRS